MSTPEQGRERMKELTAILADHAEDSMDSDDVDQIRAEIIELWDARIASEDARECPTCGKERPPTGGAFCSRYCELVYEKNRREAALPDPPDWAAKPRRVITKMLNRSLRGGFTADAREAGQALAALAEGVSALARAEADKTEADRDWVSIAAKQAARARTAEEQVAALREALERIRDNALSWHGVPPEGHDPGAGQARALAVIATWAGAALSPGGEGE